MGTTPLPTLQHQWKRETLTTERAVGQMLQHLTQLYDLIQQIQTTQYHLYLEVKQLRQGGRNV